MLSELEPLWLCWSAEAALVEVDVGLAFSLKSVIITVKSPTVTSRCWALLLSMFFNLGLEGRETHRNQIWKLAGTHQKTVQYSAIFYWKWIEFITLSFYGFSFSVLVPSHSCPFLIFLSFWGVWVVQTADSLAVQPVEKQVVAFWKRHKNKVIGLLWLLYVEYVVYTAELCKSYEQEEQATNDYHLRKCSHIKWNWKILKSQIQVCHGMHACMSV